jgi:hypothetical protein
VLDARQFAAVFGGFVNAQPDSSDGEVSILDYLILSGNFERVGDN